MKRRLSFQKNASHPAWQNALSSRRAPRLCHVMSCHVQAIQQQGHPPLFQQNIGGVPTGIGERPSEILRVPPATKLVVVQVPSL